MARKHTAEQLLRKGLCPSRIAGKMGISVASAIQYLCTRVGEGALRHSDIYFSWSKSDRALLQRAKSRGWAGHSILRERGLTNEELGLFKSLRSRDIFSGDLYEYLSSIELGLHALVRDTLEHAYGPEERGWWRKGVPLGIREDCARKREQDEDPAEDLFAYTTLINLSRIIQAKRREFSAVLPREYRTNGKTLESDILRLNQIRNAVMHPVKKRKWSEEDFEFVKSIAKRFAIYFSTGVRRTYVDADGHQDVSLVMGSRRRKGLPPLGGHATCRGPRLNT